MADSITSLIEKINIRLTDCSVYYLANDPERTLGLEHLIPNFHAVYIDQSQFSDYFRSNGIKYFCLDEAFNSINSLYRSSIKLLRHKLFEEYFASTKSAVNYVQTFKVSPAFERSVESLGAISLNTPASLNRLFENKLSQYRELMQLDLTLPETVLTKLEKAEYASLSNSLGEEFVLQINRAHTGSGTHFINSEEQLNVLKFKYPGQEVKFSKFITGESYTVNACVTSKGVFTGGLSFQITGVPELTKSRGATVGNDWSYHGSISESVRADIIKQTKIIGEYMRSKGYKGLFGLDLIVNENKSYIIEINARQPASIPMHTKIQILQGEIPLSMLHLAEFLQLDFELDDVEYNLRNTQPLKYSQIFLRPEAVFEVGGDVKTGAYRLLSDNSAIDRLNESVAKNTIFLDEEKDKPLVFSSQVFTIDQIQDAGILVLAPVKGKIVKQGQELARLQLKQSAVKAGKLETWIIESLMAIKAYLK